MHKVSVEASEYARKVVEHQARPSWESWMIRFLQECMARGPAPGLGPVLDYGCGPGKFTEMLVENGYHATGYDPNPAMLDYAMEHHSLGRYVRRLEDASGRGFRAVFVTNVLGHLPAPERTLVELSDLIWGGGRLVLFNPNLTHTVLRKPVDALVGYKPDPTLYWHWTLPQVTRMIERLGFRREWSYFDGWRWMGVRSNYAACFVKR